MPTIDENKYKWGVNYDWPLDGDEWSSSWGGTDMQWHWSILPRIHQYVPCETALEIATGRGRWTQFLIRQANQTIGIDLSDACIIACKTRFSSVKNAAFYVNDGQTLSCVEDGTVDFIFSFDSLVHVESNVVESYISEIAKKLSHNGVAFIHHSNLGEYQLQIKLARIPILRIALRWLGLLENTLHWRARSMDARKMIEFAGQSNLLCIKQELVNWGTRSALIDCFSILVRPDSKWAQDYKIIRNYNFMEETRLINNLSRIYREQ